MVIPWTVILTVVLPLLAALPAAVLTYLRSRKTASQRGQDRLGDREKLLWAEAEKMRESYKDQWLAEKAENDRLRHRITELEAEADALRREAVARREEAVIGREENAELRKRVKEQ